MIKSRRLRWTALSTGISILCGGVVTMNGCTATGKSAKGARLETIKVSPHFRSGKFHNSIPENPIPFWGSIKKFISGTAQTTPKAPLPILMRSANEFAQPPKSGLRISWFGHSTLLIEIDGHRILIDPVWSQRASPFTWIGPKRFHVTPLPMDELPKLDAVVISHDHYDHLDHRTIQALNKRNPLYIVPLGVGAHLEYWGVPPNRIIERDWWEEVDVGDLTLIATPARHFSGRSLVMANQGQTLWAGWVLSGPEHRVYFSGDTGMFPELKEIGERLGPFDATLIETGAYDSLWPDLHIGPEQAIEARVILGSGLFIPIHWGTFDLAMHAWTEPVERVLVAAEKAGVPIAIPRPGESIEPANPPRLTRWWPSVPWKTAEESPVVSSGIERGRRNTLESKTLDGGAR